MQNKLKLYGFNNLTKALSFNIYDVCYAKTEREQRDYIKYIDQQYNSGTTDRHSRAGNRDDRCACGTFPSRDYDPQGASVTFLIAEEHMKPALEPDTTIVAHLDKSHVAVHTYPEYHPDTCLATFGVDMTLPPAVRSRRCLRSITSSARSIRISSPRTTACAVFTRDIEGQKLFMDHHMTSIQDFIDPKTLERYDAYDINVYQSNLFHTRMRASRRSISRTTCSTPTSMSCRPRPDSRFTPTSDEMIEIFGQEHTDFD